jgi:uncharacterized protein with GYD domain
MMATYVRLAKLTDHGVKNIDKFGDMLVEARKVFEKNGCKILSAYSTLGRYDLVAVIEAPDEKTIMKVSTLVAKGGNFRAETLPAVSLDEFVKMTK